MYLQQLSLINFKNYAEAELTFSDGVNAFTGDNGAGALTDSGPVAADHRQFAIQQHLSAPDYW